MHDFGSVAPVLQHGPIKKAETSRPVRQYEIVLGDVVGNGAFSEVLQANYVSSSHDETICPTEEVLSYEPLEKEVLLAQSSSVVKRLTHETLTNKDQRQMAMADMNREAKVLASLSHHDNIVTLYGVSAGFWDLQDSSASPQSGFLLLEQVDTTLEQCLDGIHFPKSSRASVAVFRLNRRHKMIMETQDLRIREFALGVANALCFVHKNGYAYRDLKPANIGVSYNNGRPIVKLLDFDLARPCTDWVTGIPGNDAGGTPRYMSPEVANGNDHGLACDVHSFAMVLFQILTLQKPYANAVTKKFIYELMVAEQSRPNLNKVHSAAIRNLLAACWNPDPLFRPNFDTIIASLNVNAK